MRLAIVDDSEELLEHYGAFFSQYYKVVLYADPLKALHEISYKNFDIVILDWRMPHIYGGELLRKINAHKTGGNYIFHSNNIDPSVEDEMRSMDYVHDILYKGMDLEQSLERLRFRIKLIMNSKNTYWGGINFNDELRVIQIESSSIKLTDQEYRMFRYIVSFDTEIVSREAIIHNVWGEPVSNESIDYHISSIRKKIGEFSGLIKTKKYMGYYLDTSFWDERESPIRSI